LSTLTTAKPTEGPFDLRRGSRGFLKRESSKTQAIASIPLRTDTIRLLTSLGAFLVRFFCPDTGVIYPVYLPSGLVDQQSVLAIIHRVSHMQGPRPLFRPEPSCLHFTPIAINCIDTRTARNKQRTRLHGTFADLSSFIVQKSQDHRQSLTLLSQPVRHINWPYPCPSPFLA
jgi:hypothetical protein